MQTHDDRDYDNFRRQWLDSLESKADRMQAAGQSKITGGDEGEEPLREWNHKGVHVRHMPPEEHGILRISVGGGTDTPVELNYCVLRGNRGSCIDLLRKALKAMEAGPGANSQYLVNDIRFGRVAMILRCDCVNTTADTLHGRGIRPHSALVRFIDRPTPRKGVKPEHEEYCCDYCSYVRTRAMGMLTGVKQGTPAQL